MEVKVIGYGIARDIIGAKELVMNVDSGVNIEFLRNLLAQRFPDFDKLASLQLAVNESYVPDDFKISEGDELVLIPPVSGG